MPDKPIKDFRVVVRQAHFDWCYDVFIKKWFIWWFVGTVYSLGDLGRLVHRHDNVRRDFDA